MIKVVFDIRTEPIDELIAFLESFEDIVQEIGEDVAKQILPFLLEELKHYPATLPGQKYKRTFRLRRGMKVSAKTTNGQFKLIAINDTPYTARVVGTFNQRSLAAAAKSQAKIHQGRWPLSSATFKFWSNAALERFRELFNERLKDLGRIKSKRRRSRKG